MSHYLLDVNVVIALIDLDHEFNATARRWLGSLDEDDEWLTCPITENGAVQIKSGPTYPTGALPVAEVVDAFRSMRENGGHRFTGDTISITDTHYFDAISIASSKRLTDAYLVALAVAVNATFVSLDHRLVSAGVIGATARVATLHPESGEITFARR